MAREWAGLEVREIAPLVGLDRQTVSRWEHDKGYPRDLIVKEWATVTGTDYVWLRTGEPAEAAPRSPSPKRRPLKSTKAPRSNRSYRYYRAVA